MSTVTVVILFACISALLIWCALLPINLRYMGISGALLHKWKSERQNLIVIDLLPNAEGQAPGSIPDSLKVHECELASLLRWIPPESTLVFCQRIRIDHFDGQVEDALLRAAIDTVYLLDVREWLPLQGALPEEFVSPLIGLPWGDDN